MPIEKGYILTGADKRCMKMLEGFLPDKIFDMHAHVYDIKYMPHMTAQTDSIFIPPDGGPSGFDAYLKYQGPLYKGAKEIRANCLVVPDPEMARPGSTLREESADYLVSELNRNENLIAALPAMPEDTRQTLESLIRHERIRGFKVYHFLAKTTPTFNADLMEYIPESAWEICHERGMFLTVHIVKPRALADGNNLAYIKEMCKKYPNARLILAHGARSFAPWTAIDTIHELRPYRNAYIDISALCEPQAIVETVRELGLSRVMWGSDYPISMSREKCVSVADSFIWLGSNTLTAERSATGCELALAGIEALVAVKQACHMLCLSRGDIEDLFYNNAMNMLKLTKGAGDRAQVLRGEPRSASSCGTPSLPDFGNGAFLRLPMRLREAFGCDIVSEDGRRYYDFSSEGMALRPLGYNDRDVNAAVIRSVQSGCTGGSADETQAAAKLLALHPLAQSAYFTRGGAEAAALALQAARAVTGRPLAAVSQETILPGLDSMHLPGTITFQCGSFEEFNILLAAQESGLSCVMLPPVLGKAAESGFLEHVRRETGKRGILLILDETESGFKMCCGGTHMLFGIYPDMAVFAETLGNGFPTGAVISTGKALDEFLSRRSPAWRAESTGLAAANAALGKYMLTDVPAHIANVNRQVSGIWLELSEKHGLPVLISGGQYAWRASFAFAHEKRSRLEALFTELMAAHGFLAQTHVHASLCHTPGVLAAYRTAVDEAFGEIAKMLN